MNCWSTTRAEGDYADSATFDADVTWLRQVHGARVVRVTRPGEHQGAEADAAVTATPQCKIAVRTADCVPVAIGDAYVAGVAHAGWRGLMAGVLENTVAELRALGVGELGAFIGPHIGPECYEFGRDDLDTVAARYGEGVRGLTSDGTPALDLGAAVRAALDELGVAVIEEGECTSCRGDLYYSWRSRRENERFATIAWL